MSLIITRNLHICLPIVMVVTTLDIPVFNISTRIWLYSLGSHYSPPSSLLIIFLFLLKGRKIFGVT